MSTVMTPSKKRYNKQLLIHHNRIKETGSNFYLNYAAGQRIAMNEAYSKVKAGDVWWLNAYFSWKKEYKWGLRMNKSYGGYVMPLPG